MTTSNPKSCSAGSLSPKHPLTAHPSFAGLARAANALSANPGLGANILRVVGLVGSVGWATGCGPSDSAEARVPSCVPGTVQPCGCSATKKGVQACNDEGTFESCECSADASGKTAKASNADAGAQGTADDSSDDGDSSDSKDDSADERGTSGSAADTAAREDEAAGAANASSGSGNTSEPECQELPSNFTQDTTLAKGCYLAKVSPSFASHVTLTLAPGVTLIFEEDTGLILREDRALVAAGTAENPIVLTGAEQKRGFWQGVILDRPEPRRSRFDYVTIEYAGAEPLGTSVEVPAAGLIGIETEQLAIDHSTIRESAGFGFVFQAEWRGLGSVEHSTITKNHLGAGLMSLMDANALSTSTKFSGNDVDFVTFYDQWAETDSVTPPVLDVPYYIPNLVDMEIELNLNPGTKFVFGQDGGLLLTTGRLTVAGSAENPVVFTGLNATPGWWQGITIDTEEPNVLRHAIIEYGGSEGGGSSVVVGREFSDHPKLNIKDCVIRHSKSYGLLLRSGAEVNSDYATVNTFDDNALGDTYEVPSEDDEEDW